MWLLEKLTVNLKPVSGYLKRGAGVRSVLWAGIKSSKMLLFLQVLKAVFVVTSQISDLHY